MNSIRSSRLRFCAACLLLLHRSAAAHRCPGLGRSSVRHHRQTHKTRTSSRPPSARSCLACATWQYSHAPSCYITLSSTALAPGPQHSWARGAALDWRPPLGAKSAPQIVDVSDPLARSHTHHSAPYCHLRRDPEFPGQGERCPARPALPGSSIASGGRRSAVALRGRTRRSASQRRRPLPPAAGANCD